MWQPESLDWTDPLALIKKIPAREKCWALLYSGIKMDFTGRYSFLAVSPRNQIVSDDFSRFEKTLSADKEKFENCWFGYLGYGLKNYLEKLPRDKPSYLNFPNLWMVDYKAILVFDHLKKKIEVWSENKFDARDFFSGQFFGEKERISWLSSNMTKKEYVAKVKTIQKHIRHGDIYQANLTRKFYGEFEKPPSPVLIFGELCEKSPAPYSCLMKLGDNYIISSSPEMFLKIDSAGNVESRPIKGSAAKETGSDNLKNSEKDRAENLMIVDLVRNDLSRSCVPGSVKVESLFDVTSYSTLHHMSSTVIGRKNPGVPSFQIIKDCFPPGSMTGAPKIKAMEICSKLEGAARGVYSGAIGYIGGNGEAEFSVVIRTILLNGKTFEFQTGGAIVHDSIPEKEWQETIFKARGITAALGIKNLI